MLKINQDVLEVTLPEGKTQEELIALLSEEFKKIESEFYGKDIKIMGRITTGMSLWLGHKLAHVTNSVAIFDPKMNKFITCIKH